VFSEQVRIRINQAPDRLNPILSSYASSVQIERWLFNALQEYDPTTMVMTPVLLEESPQISTLDVGNGKSATQVDFRIRSDARWDNGEPITGRDYLFTMKACLVPDIENSSWKNFVSQITDIRLDDEDSQSVSVLANEAYMQLEEIITGFSVYPEYVYDSAGLLQDYSFKYLVGLSADSAVDENLQVFAKQFNSAEFSRENVIGSGAYELIEWKSQQSILLRRKDNWWGNDLDASNHPFLRAEPAELLYYIIPDEQTAITSLKDGALDLVSEITPEQFQELKKYQNSERPIELFAPSILQYYYIACNTQRAALSDPLTRKALAHLIDIKLMIEELFYNEALPTIGPLHPTKNAYASDLEPYGYDLSKARSLLAEAGWSDSDQDGILDRRRQGALEKLELKINTTRSQLGQDVATLLKQAAERVGVALELNPMDTRAMLQDVRAGDYDLACLAARPPAGNYDPYPNWHSDNVGANGNNFCNFSNAALDQTIEKLRLTTDDKERDLLYYQFQKILHDEQPAIFLVAPSTRIALNGKYKVLTSILKPGYFENTIAPL